MALLGHFIVRLVQILFAIAFGAFAAALFLSIGYVREFAGPAFADAAGEQANTVLITVLALFSGPFVFAGVLGPALVAVATSEILHWRGLIANLVLGGLVALYAGWRHYGGEFDPSRGALAVLLSAGFVAGLAYWLIAGRSAGRWLDRRRKQ